MIHLLGAFPWGRSLMSANTQSLLLVAVILTLLLILLPLLLPWWLAIPLIGALGIIVGLWARDW